MQRLPASPHSSTREKMEAKFILLPKFILLYIAVKVIKLMKYFIEKFGRNLKNVTYEFILSRSQLVVWRREIILIYNTTGEKMQNLGCFIHLVHSVYIMHIISLETCVTL